MGIITAERIERDIHGKTIDAGISWYDRNKHRGDLAGTMVAAECGENMAAALAGLAGYSTCVAAIADALDVSRAEVSGIIDGSDGRMWGEAMLQPSDRQRYNACYSLAVGICKPEVR